MKNKRFHLSLSAKSSLTGFAFVSPFIIGFLFFFLKPLIQSITFVFSKVDITNNGYATTFTGLENLNYLFQGDANFGPNLAESVINLLWQAPMVMVFSLFFAIILNQKFKGRVVARAIFFLPVIIASGLIIQIIMSDSAASSALSGEVVAAGGSTQSDVLQELLKSSGLNSKIITAVTTVTDSMFNLTWKTGIQMLIFLAGLQSIPGALYEAASIEGATSWEIFWKITLPMMVPMIMLNLVYTIVDNFTSADNQVMQQVMANSRLVRYGWASAMSWVYTLLISVVIALVFFIFAKINKEPKLR